jgi:hypothetical protein
MTDEACFPSLADAVEPARRPAFERLREAWRARLRPVDAAEELLIDAIVARAWRAGRLDALEERVMRALLDEGRPRETLPALGTLLRCRARLDKDRAQLEAERETLCATRPQPAPCGTEGAPDRATAEQAARGVEPLESVAPTGRSVEARPDDRPPETGEWIDPLEEGAARYEPRPATASERPRPLPREVEELLAQMWRPAGGPETVPRRLAATG